MTRSSEPKSGVKLMAGMGGKRTLVSSRHYEERSDAAIQSAPLDCRASLAMTNNRSLMTAMGRNRTLAI